MLWFKACKRCGGDLSEKLGIEGNYVACVQCSRELPVREERELRSGRRQAGPAVAKAA